MAILTAFLVSLHQTNLIICGQEIDKSDVYINP